MVEKDRILAKLDQLEGYLRALRQILPESFEGDQKVEKKQACEKLLQIAVEATIDILPELYAGLLELREHLGKPSREKPWPRVDPRLPAISNDYGLM